MRPKRRPQPILSLLLLCALAATSPGQAPASPQETSSPFELKDGDRVLLVGGTFIEREGQLGFIEAALTAAFPDRNVTFRNLGQSGDTVLADARNLNAGWVNFGPPEQGFNRLKKLVGEIKPTVIIANYGMTESFAGPARLDEFLGGYDRLLRMMVTESGEKPRLVIVSPNYHEDLGKPHPDPTRHNEHLRLYRDATKKLAEKFDARFVDLYALTEKIATQDSPKNITANGIHPTPEGYRLLAAELLKSMKIAVKGSLSDERFEKLRKLVVDKNFQYFNYWRPQNDTYILGYRKKEQGRNAVEMPMFLPLVEAKEKEIAAAR